jgi:uncharacterized membrane protein YgcG
VRGGRRWPRALQHGVDRRNALGREGHHEEHPTGLKRWLFTTNHKDIGTLYLLFALLMFFVGGTMAMVIRAELFQPGLQYVNPELFNQLEVWTNKEVVLVHRGDRFAQYRCHRVSLFVGHP